MALPPAATLLPGIPLIESPFYDEIFVEGAFEPEILRLARDLHRDGYVVFDFPDGDFMARSGRIRESLNGRYDWDGWRTGKRESLRVQDAWDVNEDVKSIALNPRIIEILSALYGRKVFPFQTLNFPVGTQQQIHSDSAHFSSFPERFMCGVWVALEDIGIDQGPLVYLPGSHSWPLYTNEHLGVNTSFLRNEFEHYGNLQSVWKHLIAKRGIEPKRFLARKGQALIWMANLLHGGDRQNDLSLTRWSQVTHYFFEGCSYYTPLMSDPFYGRIHFRELRNIATGNAIKHGVGGYDSPDEFVARASKPVVRDAAFHNRLGLPAGFEAAAYLKLNPDVAAAGVDPGQHYLDHGAVEGRRWRA
jgi:hypothetical protein